MRTTPDEIKKLEQGQIFVFGSNLSGRHGKGAAKTALGHRKHMVENRFEEFENKNIIQIK